jgi:hypothetical protein
MEVMLRCTMTDRPGSLAALTHAIGEAGGDIQAVDVVEHDGGVALDDLVVVVRSGAHLRALLDQLGELEGVEVVHAGPSRGHPGDAVTRLAVGLEAVLNGAMAPSQGVTTLLGGLLRVTSAELVRAPHAPADGDSTMVLPFGAHVLVLTREYRFTSTERHRAAALARLCLALEGARAQPDASSRVG